MTYDLIVVGAGLAGLFAGVLAARRGARTLVLARGVGATHVGAGSIDILGYDREGRRLASPAVALPEFIKRAPGHPYALAGLPALEASLSELAGLCEAAGYPLAGELDRNFWLPTAAGAVRPTCLAPESFVAGDVRRAEPMTLAALPRFRDYYAEYAAANLRCLAPGLTITARAVSLPELPARRELYATDLARLLDEPTYRAMAFKAWKSELAGPARAGFPAILGLEYGPAAWRDLTDRLEAEVFEIPLLPPSVPGMRLYNILAVALTQAGGELVLGPPVMGRIDGRGDTPRVMGVTAHTASGWKLFEAGAVILATGGFLGGGLVSERPGSAAESVFDLPVIFESNPQAWFHERLLGNHPYARFGLRVDSDMRALDAGGSVMYGNLFAVGAVLAGADRLAEGSREGISLATAYKAVAALDRQT